MKVATHDGSFHADDVFAAAFSAFGAAVASFFVFVAFAGAFFRCPRSALACAAADLIRPSARMKPRGIGWPDTGKFSTARWVWAP